MITICFLSYQFNLGLPELIIFQLGAVILGFAIHFFWVSRKAMAQQQSHVKPKIQRDEVEEWRVKYFNLMDKSDQEKESLRKLVDEGKKIEKELREEIEDYRTELNEFIRQQREEKKEWQAKLVAEAQTPEDTHAKRLQAQIESNNILQQDLRATRALLAEKETLNRELQQKAILSRELQERLDKAYQEFYALQEKLGRMNEHLYGSHHKPQQYDEVQQAYFRVAKEYDDLKLKQLSMLEENQRLSRLLADTEDKLKEANFQRQQLLKKVGFLEEMNQDLQQVNEHQKRMDTQIRRMGEIQQLLGKIAGNEEDNTEG